MSKAHDTALVEACREHFVDRARRREFRSLGRWMTDEITLPPGGPFENQRFNIERVPYVRVWLDALDALGGLGCHEIAATGPTQSGKTLTTFTGPALHQLFEMRTDVIVGIPDLNMASDKWTRDFLPIINGTRYGDLLPDRGDGSRGGTNITSVQFKNGRTLRFMAGGGGPTQRAGYTAPNIFITEVDGFTDDADAVEASKIEQLKGRARAHGESARVWLECTVTIPEGRIWTTYQAGSRGRIAHPCPYCGAWVSPEREHFRGWKMAEDVRQARDEAHFVCPACEHRITPEDRASMNRDARLVHRGQTVEPDGTVAGEFPPTDSLTFRWSAFQNLLTTEAMIGREEYMARHADDPDDWERKLCQQVWAIPYVAATLDTSKLDEDRTRRRVLLTCPRGLVPADADYVTVGIDVQKRVIYWVIIAWWTETGRGVVVNYGTSDVLSDDLTWEVAIVKTLRDFREWCEHGFPQHGTEDLRVPDQVWWDCGWQGGTDGEHKVLYRLVREFAFESSPDAYYARYRPCFGRGTSQFKSGVYKRPAKPTTVVRYIDDGYHIRVRDDREIGRIHIVEIDVDFWKSRLHDALRPELNDATPGTLALFSDPNENHITYVKHLTSEYSKLEFVPDRGETRRWFRHGRRQNHYLDATMIACVAGHLLGFRFTKAAPRPPAAADDNESTPAVIAPTFGGERLGYSLGRT